MKKQIAFTRAQCLEVAEYTVLVDGLASFTLELCEKHYQEIIKQYPACGSVKVSAHELNTSTRCRGAQKTIRRKIK